MLTQSPCETSALVEIDFEKRGEGHRRCHARHKSLQMIKR
jgi:hypothetical protein